LTAQVPLVHGVGSISEARAAPQSPVITFLVIASDQNVAKAFFESLNAAFTGGLTKIPLPITRNTFSYVRMDVFLPLAGDRPKTVQSDNLRS